MVVTNCSLYANTQYNYASSVITSSTAYWQPHQPKSEAERVGDAAMHAIKMKIPIYDCGDPDLRAVLDALDQNDEEKIAIMGGEWAVRHILGKLLMKNIKVKDAVNA